MKNPISGVPGYNQCNLKPQDQNTMECYKSVTKCINIRGKKMNSYGSIFSLHSVFFILFAQFPLQKLFSSVISQEEGLVKKGQFRVSSDWEKFLFEYILLFYRGSSFFHRTCEQCSPVTCANEEFRFPMQDRTYPHQSYINNDKNYKEK